MRPRPGDALPCGSSAEPDALRRERMDGLRRKLLLALGLAALVVGALAAPAMAYVYPSTNDDNRDNGHPHVNQVDVGIGEVTLEFVNETNSLAFFEYRIDGEVLTSGTAHPVVTGDFIYDGVCVDGRPVAACDDGPVSVTFDANATVEVRLALGGERDWDFDWVTFEVLPDAQTKEDCKNGGWRDFGFRNQGQCIRFVQTGQDSRD